MKSIVFYSLLIFFLMACKKNETDLSYPDAVFVEPKYDTTPVDSFSPGATSAEVARRIRMASAQYQESLRLALQKEAEIKKQKSLEEKLKKEMEKKIKAENSAETTTP